MIKYHWQQRYALDRFDLEGPMGRLVGWIVGTPDQLGGLIGSFVFWKADSVKVNQTCYCEVE